MKNNFRLYILVLFILLGTIISIVYLFVENNNYKIVSVNYRKAFEEFQLKKDLEKKLQSSRFIRQRIIDSLGFEFNKLVNSNATNPKMDQKKYIREREQEYYNKRELFKQDDTNEASAYDQQIFNQMKQYAREFALINKYDFVLADDGEFEIIYANTTYDVTKEFSQFINNKLKVSK